ncbi:glycoside hydrolase family 68 protein [Bacillus tianshenii]|nr:glycoside hydrolase family 68 protein [Bacillus tianshenii]
MESLRVLKKTIISTAAAVVVASSFALPLNVNAEEKTPAWTRQQAEKLERTKDTTAPYIKPDFEQIDPDHWVWDSWPLRNEDGSVAKVKGNYVLFALTAPDDVLPGKRHDIAQIRYYYSKNGKDWKLGGPAFDKEDAFGSRQWAGSAMLDDNGKIHLFYTATGRKDDDKLTYEQRLAKASGEINVNKSGVHLENWGEHKIILKPKGKYYQTMEQSEGGIIYAFRDPWFYKDPKTGKEYILFEGNSPGKASEQTCQPHNIGDEDYRQNHTAPDGSAQYNGNVGIAVAEDDSMNNWEMLPPLLEADCVNQQLERPHIVNKGGQYYLFVDSHKFTFAPGLKGVDGLYGFTSDRLDGDYKPLNESGLVIANPKNNPFQAYSWIVLPNGKVISFINYFDLNGVSLKDVGSQSEQFQYDHFGGTLAPTLKLSIHGDETQIVNTQQHGKIN